NGGLTTDATLGRTARASLEHLRRQTGFPSWLLTRINDYERIVVAAVDPEFSIVANSVLPNDLSTDRFLGNVSKLVVPVQLPNGQQYGALIGLSRDLPAPMPAHAESLVPLLANMLGSLAGAEANLAASVRRAERDEAPRDALTGVATRQAWETQLSRDDERCNANGEQAWVFMICLDELHELNKRQGHEAGDELLSEFGKLLESTVDGRHFCARITGLQFGVLAVDLCAAEATTLETNLRQTLSAAGIGAWVGVGRRLPGVGLGAALDAAEASIAAARSAVSIATTRFDDATAELVNALDRGQIRAYFQPIVDMRTGDVVAIEALARWQTDSGIREPYEFLPGIERAGLNASLFQRMLDDGLSHLATFRNVSPNLRLAVNFDFDSIPASGLRKTVTDLADKHNVPLELISLELSERQSFDLSPSTLKELTDVADSGVKLVLDDFGVGFASLETLTSLPISGVKLDRRFTGQVIDGEREPAVVKAMISMAADAGLEVIAEGVETQTQCDRLVRLGCRLGQGYLFALPLPPDSMTTVLSAPLVSAW
ncbi:MAG TPA: GGDEF and EAL domain-containing protein, partial [Ilumatobacteraceae bacterium]|nr:GGDEF and EAL domain-containing protein [Ilumatobacteraceae bacterium]